MDGYICRLIKCGYTIDKAQEIRKDILKNFSVAELEVFVRYIEDLRHVG